MRAGEVVTAIAAWWAGSVARRIALVCWLLVAGLLLVAGAHAGRTVAGWHRDARELRAVRAAAAMDTLREQRLARELGAATRAAAVARAGEASAAARLDTAERQLRQALARWAETRGTRGGETRVATVAPSIGHAPDSTLVRACTALADACTAFRDSARVRAAADSLVIARHDSQLTEVPARLKAAVVGARAPLLARLDTLERARPRWWRPTVVAGGGCVVAAGIVTCGPGLTVGWRITR